jgi:hypothetical protein
VSTCNDEFSQHLDKIWSTYHLNVKRIERLTRMGVLFAGAEDWTDYYEAADESLRAAIVLMHASLEHTLREIVRFKLGDRPSKVIDTIPLVGTSSTGQARKFSLGELSKHRGKTVQDLIQQSVDEYLDMKSFSSAKDIAHILKKSGIDISSLCVYFPDLEQMISRRHQIVHTADLEWVSGESRPVPIDSEEVVKWMVSSAAFVADLCCIVCPGLEAVERARQNLHQTLESDRTA